MDPQLWRFFWQRPRTHRDVIGDRRVSALELFYDLIYVVLISRISLGLHTHVTVSTVTTFAILFGLVWIGWYNGTLLHDAHGRPDVRNRLLTFLQILTLTLMAVFAPDAVGGGGVWFAASYTAFLVILVGQWITVARTERDDPFYGRIASRYTTILGVMTLWVAASIPAPQSLRPWMWGVFLVSFVVAMTASGLRHEDEADRPPGAVDPMATESLLERFSLFVIIVLGEVVASVVSGIGAEEHPSARMIVTGLAGLGVGIALWWTYFDMIGMRPLKDRRRPRYLYTLLQMPLTLAITGVGAATVSLIEHPHGPNSGATWAFSGSVALAMLSMVALARQLRDWNELRAMFIPATRSAYLVAVLALALAAFQASPLVLMGVLFVSMCAQWLYAVAGWLRTAQGREAVALALTSTTPGDGAHHH